MKFPEHKASLHLTHNQHKAYYLSVADSIRDNDPGYTEDCWISPQERDLAIATDECWTLQWYPKTPIGSYSYSAAQLEPLLDFVNNLP